MGFGSAFTNTVNRLDDNANSAIDWNNTKSNPGSTGWTAAGGVRSEGTNTGRVGGGGPTVAGGARSVLEDAGYTIGSDAWTKDKFDLSDPGAGEQWWSSNQDRFGMPTASNQYFDSTKGYYTSPTSTQGAYDANSAFYQGPSEMGNYWQGVQGRYGGGGPNYMQQAWGNALGTSQNLDPYYDRAFSRGQDRVNRAAASRGMFGSSGAMRDITDLATGLGAEQANREGDYQLNRAQLLSSVGGAASGDERAWMQGLGAMAAGADASNLALRNAGVSAASAADAAGLNRTVAGQSAASAADSADLSQLLGGGNMAFNAQAAKEGRIGGIYDRMFNQDSRYAGIAGGANNAAIDDYLGLTGDEIAMALGIPREQINSFNQSRAADQASIANLFKIFAMFYGGGGG